jgi:8-amino-7-oxononanoate synthase
MSLLSAGMASLHPHIQIAMNDYVARPVMESPPDAETTIDGRRYLYFGGTGYLGLAARAEVIEAACAATRQYGIHTATSRSGFGTNPPTLAVERRAAEFFATEEAFYFASGYVGNHILIQALAARFDVVLADESSHFSLCEASHLTGTPVVAFRHLDPDDLRRQLHAHCSSGQRPLVMSDGMFSLTGQLAPLDEYVQLLSNFQQATLLVDDAHGVGTLGEHGRGTLEHLGLLGPNVNADVATAGVGIYFSGTLSKAFGGFGGVVPGTHALTARARTSSHYFDGASAAPSAAAGASAKAIEIVLREPELRQRLRANAAHFRAGLRGLGLTVDESPAPIVGLAIGDGENMRRIHQALRTAGILVPYFAAYSGSGKHGRLRIAVFVTHTSEMLDRLVAELGRVL